jgi:CheY-like chemotaxis protein
MGILRDGAIIRYDYRRGGGTSVAEHLPILQGTRILVLEDDDDTRNLLNFVLESHGANVVLTSNVPQALQAMQNQRPIDVVVADIGMPDFNGFAFVTSLRNDELPEIQKTPVIALTAYNAPGDRDRAIASGFNEYLNKPFHPGELTSMIKRLHDAHRMQ